MKLFTNKIDRLAISQSRLVVKKQKTQDRQNEINSKIETKIKELENMAFRNKQIADGKIKEIEREIEKNKEQIKLEARYYNDIAKGAINE